MIPPILIVTDRGHLVAYRSKENESIEQIEQAEFEEGKKKISEIVTDQSGAFANSGTPGTGSHESLPLVAELEVRSFKKIAQKIGEIIDRENPRWWGFSAPSEINNAILDHLEDKHRDKISRNLKVDLANSRPSDVLARFEKAAII